MTKTWEDGAYSALIRTYENVRYQPQSEMEDMRQHLDEFIDSHFHSEEDTRNLGVFWSVIGADAIEISKSRGTPLLLHDVHRTLIRKQRDYGPENIRRFGRQGLMVRMHDKVARLENLLSIDGGGKPNNESIEDNLLDVVGYAAIGVMWEQGTFFYPLASPALSTR